MAWNLLYYSRELVFTKHNTVYSWLFGPLVLPVSVLGSQLCDGASILIDSDIKQLVIEDL